MSDIQNGAPMGKGGAGIGPYNPVTEQNVGHKYFQAVNRDLAKRFGKSGNKKSPSGKRGNKVAT